MLLKALKGKPIFFVDRPIMIWDELHQNWGVGDDNSRLANDRGWHFLWLHRNTQNGIFSHVGYICPGSRLPSRMGRGNNAAQNLPGFACHIKWRFEILRTQNDNQLLYAATKECLNHL
jgi:hypothetical protein